MSDAKITNKMQKKICVLIMSWQSKLTWDLLVKAIKHDFDLSVTRQTLKDYIAIKNAWDDKKQELRLGKTPVNQKLLSATEADLIKKVTELEARVDLAEKDVNNQLSFIEDIYENAVEMNVNVDKLLKRRNS